MTSQNRRLTMKDNQAKYPQLRFKGFTDPWEERKLEDIFLYKQGQQVPVENQFTKPGKHRHRFIRIVDLTTTDEEPRYIEYSGHNTISATDLFMIRYGQPGVIGYGYEGVIANNLFKLIPKVKANNRFFKYRLDSMYPKIQSLSSSTTMPAISFKSLDVLDVRYPDIKEQEKIGAFFKQLDDTIALHQRKLAMLKELKQGYLQKLFPQNGSNFPQLRFAGFADAWEQRKLGDLGDILRKSIDPQLTPSREFVEYSMPSYDRGKRPNRVLGESMQSTRLKISGTVLLINKLNVRQRRIWFVKKAPENAVASGEFVPFQSFEIDLGFLHQLFLSDKTTSELQSISSGTSNSQKRVTPSDLLHYPICIPTTKGEQVVVGRFLSSIDNLITLHQRKLEKLQELKKGYLQKMFC